MDRVYIAWSTENLITVCLMAAAGYVAFGLLFQLIQQFRGQQKAA